MLYFVFFFIGEALTPAYRERRWAAWRAERAAAGVFARAVDAGGARGAEGHRGAGVRRNV